MQFNGFDYICRERELVLEKQSIQQNNGIGGISTTINIDINFDNLFSKIADAFNKPKNEELFMPLQF